MSGSQSTANANSNTLTIEISYRFRNAQGQLINRLLGGNSPEFPVVAAVINLGISLLGTTCSRTALRDIGNSLIRSRPNALIRTVINANSSVTMDDAADHFLTCLRSSFPSVIVSPFSTDEGSYQRHDWAPQAPRNYDDYDPATAGTLTIQSLAIDNLLWAAQEREAARGTPYEDAFIEVYENTMFLMGVTVAHELVHAWIGYLMGTARPNTPPGISYLPGHYTDPASGNGEAGREWEYRVFGGSVEAFYNERSRLRDRQGGELFILDSNRQYTRLTRRAIGQLVRFEFDQMLAVNRRTRQNYLYLETQGNPRDHDDLEEDPRLTHMERVRGRILNLDTDSSSTSSGDSSRSRGVRGYLIRGEAFRNLRRIPSDPRRIIGRA